ncbi:MAG: NAD(+) kinase [Gammaproteobacteria bacterium]|nr:NAD(+) kinase [Gammaproteobacteria bacterium]MBU1655330.1 NAD(+) kinase [Gammaproteobacteria bacterium]MBU1960991.1 NAD(+) kinase [Gammaproteobacteria bacterium]
MALQFNRIGLIAKPDPVVTETLATLTAFLSDLGCTLALERETASLLLPGAGYETHEAPALAASVDLLVTLGGDGTLLGAARLLAERDIPLLGVNLGRLGFLTDISPADMTERLAIILQGEFDEERRFLLRTEILHEGNVALSQLAFNDAVIHKWNTARLIEFETYVNGRFVDFQRSDGLIVSTPTGSTAYALSGGGPLMEPDLDAILMVPICPHTLSNRPIVVGGDSLIDIVVCGSTDPQSVRVSCDGQVGQVIERGDRVRISRHPRDIRLIHPKGHDHFNIMRTKLGWSEHPAQS